MNAACTNSHAKFLIYLWVGIGFYLFEIILINQKSARREQNREGIKYNNKYQIMDIIN